MKSFPRSRRPSAGGGVGGGVSTSGLGDGEEDAATRGDGEEGVATRGEGAGEGDGRSRGAIIKKAATPSRAIVPRPRAAARTGEQARGSGGNRGRGCYDGLPGRARNGGRPGG